MLAREVRENVTRLITITLFTIAVGAAGATTASAQATQPGSPAGPVATAHWTVTPFIGFPFSGDIEGGATGFGVAGGYTWNSRVAVETELAVFPTVPEGPLINFDASTWNLTGNLLYHFAPRSSRITPFVIGGLGVGHANTDILATDPLLREFGATDSSTGFIVNFGGGLKYYLNDRFGVRGDLRYFTGHDLVPDHLRLSFGLGIDLGRLK